MYQVCIVLVRALGFLFTYVPSVLVCTFLSVHTCGDLSPFFFGVYDHMSGVDAGTSGGKKKQKTG